MDRGERAETLWIGRRCIMISSHLDERRVCPYLPAVKPTLRAASMKQCGKDRGESFYLLALECAQSLWLQGLPAQSMLLLNRAFSADLKGHEPVLGEWPLPYAAMVWVMKHHRKGDFIGNPRRHFQHLATRMVEPRKEVRSWRAWACWWYACQVFAEMPADELQIETEGILEPSEKDIVSGLGKWGIEGEVAAWQSAIGVL